VGRTTIHPPRTIPLIPEDIEEALAVGRAARELTESPAYQTVMQALEAYHVAAMVAAPEGPDGRAEREHHHRLLYALRELAGNLAARVLAAAEIETRLAERSDDEDEVD
jgi:hypothetical protein